MLAHHRVHCPCPGRVMRPGSVLVTRVSERHETFRSRQLSPPENPLFTFCPSTVPQGATDTSGSAHTRVGEGGRTMVKFFGGVPLPATTRR
ncbi:hypothetical protein B005_4548 [Nocardiopsis alba ATCC BAA-2165]|uniref:Uncharacterized protein n=1 Tax=Nocardiopsis alba (strain ATCC BAA-2165 / BE74) TaxID=1205910 RepID=J7L565_NOCAA|nr:hypothetical protein B005_4548 [Nocardiopsis alba ATCC BAA-2165]